MHYTGDLIILLLRQVTVTTPQLHVEMEDASMACYRIVRIVQFKVVYWHRIIIGTESGVDFMVCYE